MTRVEGGQCFCGANKAVMTGEPFWICYDHDGDCRRAIDSPLTIWIGYRSAQVTFTAEEPRRFSKTRGVTRTFCSSCASSMTFVDDGLPDEIYVDSGFMDHPERFPPAAHGYWEMKLPFIEINDDLPKNDTYTRDRDVGLGFPNKRHQDDGRS